MAQRGRTPRPARTHAPAALPKLPAAAVTAVRDRVVALISPELAAAGYDLEELTIKQVGRRHLVRVAVDGDGGVNLDTIADLSRLIADALDDAEATGKEIIPGEYQLEVSSPGTDRPLTLPRHWRRATGRLVSVRTGDRQITGRVLAVREDATGGIVEFEVGDPKKPKQAPVVLTFALADLGPGRVQIEFNRMADLSDDDLEEIGDEEDDDAGDEDDDDEDVEEQ